MFRHLVHNVIGNGIVGRVSQVFRLWVVAVFALQLHGGDAMIIDMGVQCADENQEPQQQQGQDQLLQRERNNNLLIYLTELYIALETINEYKCPFAFKSIMKKKQL